MIQVYVVVVVIIIIVVVVSVVVVEIMENKLFYLAHPVSEGGSHPF